MDGNDQKAIEFRNVSFRVADGKTLLSGINLEIYRGETLVLLGRSGCGKTTTLKLINRLLDPTEGEVHVEGRATTEWEPIRLRRRIGYVIQEIGLFPHFTVQENVSLVPCLEGWEEEKVRVRSHQLLEMVGLEPGRFAARYPPELSGGQRQRVGVARALAADPPIMLLDEPFGALDPITRRELQQEFCSLQRRLKKTLVFVTHDVQEAFLLASRIGLLKDGKMVLLGQPDELLKSDDPEARAFALCLRDPRASETAP
ncbi:MAG: ABC transporter ATP-binding protein [Deltaproteobacteria bacterium GWA2_57_13]|nr:MAG: ABC transporter ATP-binding protein [Deltaproteobacteria bacterium GWA2_57_13]